MQALLTDLYANASGPLLSALLLGLLIAIAPCPMTLNITAIGFIGKNISDKRKVLANGIFYALGTVVSYSGLALILYFGADRFSISSFFQQYSEMIVGPLLLLVGVYMTGLFRLDFPMFTRYTKRFEHRIIFRSWDSFFLGVILALAFCPYSGVLFFGMLIPLMITTSSPLSGLAFSVAAGVSVVVFAWLLAFTVSGIGTAFNRLKAFEFWFKKVIAVLFICVGVYYIIQVWI